MAIDPITLTRQLIDIPSVTGQELAVGEFLEARLTQLGFSCRRQTVGEGRFNLFAAAGGRPRVIVNSHIDTVPPWFQSSEDGQYVYGRGACDTKGIIAAMIAAGERLRLRGLTDFAFLFVVAEETDSIGAKVANSEFAALGSEYVVVGEPTESKFARATKGAFTCTVRFEGKAAHSAYPERGDSAIAKLALAVTEINNASWGEDPLLGRATANVGVVRGGQKPNVIPAEAEAEMIFRIVTDLDTFCEKLNALLARHDGRVVRSHGNPPQILTVPDGAESSVVSFNTDVPHLRSLGKPLLFGPGSILDAHGDNEKISKKELLDAITTYEDMVVTLLKN